MSRASVYTSVESRSIPTEYPLDTEPIKMWTESRSAIKNNSLRECTFDTSYFCNNSAGLVEASIYRIIEQLARQLFASTHLVYTPCYAWGKLETDRKQDIWVDMPPLSTEKVVMRAKDMGRGEPLAILDPLPEK